MTDTDIGTLEQEIRQVRARLARVEGERDGLLTAMEYTLNMLLSNPDTKSALFSAESILHEAIATVKGSQ